MLNLRNMKKRRKFDRGFKKMFVEIINNREDILALAAELAIYKLT